MMLYVQQRTAPVRSADAAPMQQRLAEERHARLERIRRAAVAVPAHSGKPRPALPRNQRRLVADAVRHEWGFQPDPAPYEMLHMSLSIAPLKLSWRDIVDEVCDAHAVTYAEIVSELRSVRVVAARFEAIYRIREERHLSWAQLGRLFNRDHTSALHGYRTHKAKLEATA